MKFYKNVFIILLYFIAFPLNASSHFTPKKILIVVAMNSEAKPIITSLHLQKVQQQFFPLPMQAYSGTVKNNKIFLIENGEDSINHVQNVGTQAATLATYLGIERWHPNLIISIGTAGGVAFKDAKINQIYYSNKINFLDRRIPIKGYQQYGLGNYTSFDISSYAQNLDMKPGIVCSGDSFDDDNTDYAMILKLKCSAIDMEAAGVAWVGMLTKTPMFAIKGITNSVRGENIHEEYRKNVSVVTSMLAETLKKLLLRLS